MQDFFNWLDQLPFIVIMLILLSVYVASVIFETVCIKERTDQGEQ